MNISASTNFICGLNEWRISFSDYTELLNQKLHKFHESEKKLISDYLELSHISSLNHLLYMFPNKSTLNLQESRLHSQ